MTEYEFSQEQFRNLQQEFWCKFYDCCVQYHVALSHPLALHLNPHTNMVCLLKKVRELARRELLQTVSGSRRILVCCVSQLAVRTFRTLFRFVLVFPRITVHLYLDSLLHCLYILAFYFIYLDIEVISNLMYNLQE